MNIYIDESGSFVSAGFPGGWNSVLAYASPERDKRHLANILRKLRLLTTTKPNEVKLKHLQEKTYFNFLEQLGDLHGIVNCVAIDVGINDLNKVADHRNIQAKKIIEHVDKMIHQSMKDGLYALHDSILTLPPQLYIQLVCQIELFHNVVASTTLYFSQRIPATLSEFRWRIDRKDILRETEYEKAMEILAPPLLQSKAIRDPIICVHGFDYSHMKNYEFTNNYPTYLKDTYGIEVNDGFNVGKIVRGNYKLVDSKDVPGIQIADLLASGVRRCLRRGFSNNEKAAELLGRLIVQRRKGEPCVHLVSLDKATTLDRRVETLIRIMNRSCKNMLL